MSKYVIKNCPCYFNKPEADCWADQLSWCKNINDCVMKQIVELCRKAPILNADWILDKLDIQEVE